MSERRISADNPTLKAETSGFLANFEICRPLAMVSVMAEIRRPGVREKISERVVEPIHDLIRYWRDVSGIVAGQLSCPKSNIWGYNVKFH